MCRCQMPIAGQIAGKPPKKISSEPINTNKQMLRSPSRIDQDTMYHLQCGHQSIDGVLWSGNYIFLIQVSLSSYASHKAKGTSIFKQLSKSNLSVMEFYKNLADPNLTPVYVYLSPNETGYPHDQFDTDMVIIFHTVHRCLI